MKIDVDVNEGQESIKATQLNLNLIWFKVILFQSVRDENNKNVEKSNLWYNLELTWDCEGQGHILIVLL